jgi:hypothetical protein
MMLGQQNIKKSRKGVFITVVYGAQPCSNFTKQMSVQFKNGICQPNALFMSFLHTLFKDTASSSHY